MRITIGTTTLGDYPGQTREDDIPVMGLSGSADGDTQQGRGTCDGLTRLRDRGNYRVSIDVPTMRAFDSVAEAQKWIFDSLKKGGYEGALKLKYDDGSETTYPWAVARPSSMTHQGLTVKATWRIEAGKKLE